MALRSYNHAWHAFPEINFLPILIETDHPTVGPGTKRKHWKRMRKMVCSKRKVDVVPGGRPDELAILVMKRDAMMAFADCLADFNGEPDGSAGDFREAVWILTARLSNFPAQKSRFGSRPANL